jgi:hypothetical protein
MDNNVTQLIQKRNMMTYLKLPIIKNGAENQIFKLGVYIFYLEKRNDELFQLK